MHLELHAGAPSEWRESTAEQCAEGGLSSTSHPTSDPHHHHHHDGQSKKKKPLVSPWSSTLMLVEHSIVSPESDLFLFMKRLLLRLQEMNRARTIFYSSDYIRGKNKKSEKL